MRYLLNAIYLAVLLAYLPVVWIQRLFKGKKRPGLWTKFTGRGPVGKSNQNRILFHAVSLGEVNAICRLVKEFNNRNPDWEIFISTTTQTGQEAAKRQLSEYEVCLLPFDFSWSVSRFLSNLKPDVMVLAELEIWPNLLAECQRRNITTCLVNGRLGEKSFRRYSRLIRLLGNVFSRLDIVCCQNDVYADRFASLGVPRHKITVTGNLKYDSLLDDRDHPEIKSFRELATIRDDEVVWIAGSTQAPEEKLVIEAYLQLEAKHPELRLLICPRHPERFDEVAALLRSSGIEFSRRSERAHSKNPGVSSECSRVLLLDCMGELKYWWGTGHVAFVGGSFGDRGGQNMIEPLALGNAVCFGPNTRNFAQEVSDLLLHDAAVQLERPEDLVEFVGQCIGEVELRHRLVQNARSYLNEHSSAGKNELGDSAWSKTLLAIDAAFEKSVLPTSEPSKASSESQAA